jgi:hypothetical protein
LIFSDDQVASATDFTRETLFIKRRLESVQARSHAAGLQFGMASSDGDKVFTLVVGDRPILAFSAAGQEQAQEIVTEPWLKHDLSNLQSEGRPVWDGNAMILVRPASTSEIIAFHEKRDITLVGEGEILMAFVVALDE